MSDEFFPSVIHMVEGLYGVLSLQASLFKISVLCCFSAPRSARPTTVKYRAVFILNKRERIKMD